jgi:acyl carrier protein phosphodiesterase
VGWCDASPRSDRKSVSGVVLGIMWRKVLIDKWRKNNPNNSEAQEFPTITVEGYVSHEHALRAGN